MKLGVDSRHADQQVRGAVVLPNGTGKSVRVLAICKGDAAKDAEAAGAEFVGAEEMVQKIQSENWMDFDVLITTPDMMGLVGRLGKILGPRGLMPNPKAGTVTREIGKAVTDAKAGKIEYRLDKTNIIHCAIGKVSFGAREAGGELRCTHRCHHQGKAGCCKGPVYPFLCGRYHDGPGRQDEPEQSWRWCLTRAIPCVKINTAFPQFGKRIRCCSLFKDSRRIA